MSDQPQALSNSTRGSVKGISDGKEKPYVYDRLISSGSIRLFTLKPGKPGSAIVGTLHQVDLPDEAHTSPKYTALSYAWGSPNDHILPIWVNDRLFRVRENLFTALQALRDEDLPKRLWIDALCISQDNIAEKNHQVGLMARIFRTAEKVLVWLGLIDDECRMAFNFMQSTQEVESDKRDATGEPSRTHIKAVASVLQRKYWTRAWIVQEVLLGQRIELICGEAMLTWTKFAGACRLLQQYLPSGQALHLVNQRNAIQNDQRILLDQTLESLIRTYKECECSDRRDRVFALLALAIDCASGQGIQADYALPRLELLVKILDFCKPDDPVDFISLLLQAFTRDEGDKAWRSAWMEWDTRRLQRNDFNYLLRPQISSPELRVVTITHLVAGMSASWDWVRYYSFNALVDAQYVAANSGEISTLMTNFGQPSSIVKGQRRYSDNVGRIDDSNVAIILHESQIAIVSTSQMTATVNPCHDLGLHEESSTCSWAQCAKLNPVGDRLL